MTGSVVLYCILGIQTLGGKKALYWDKCYSLVVKGCWMHGIVTVIYSMVVGWNDVWCCSHLSLSVLSILSVFVLGFIERTPVEVMLNSCEKNLLLKHCVK